MEWMLMPLRRYADFSGRSRRKEYWMFTLFNLLVSSAVGVLALALFLADFSESAMVAILYPVLGLAGLYGLAAIVPGLAVTIRRLHDTDRSGWWLLVGLVPVIGPLLLLAFYVTEGTLGPNRFGPDPVTDRVGQPAII